VKEIGFKEEYLLLYRSVQRRKEGRGKK